MYINSTSTIKNIEIKDLSILIVEDVQADADLIIEILSEMNVNPQHIMHVETIAQAINCMPSVKVDAILLDLRLPDAVGIQCVNAIRELTYDIPIVVLTGLEDEKLAIACIEAGAQDYLSKQEIKAQNLKRSINYAIARVHEVSEHRRADTLHQHVAEMKMQLLMADRMASLGILIAGVTHEINNPLTIIISHLEIFMEAINETMDKESSMKIPIDLLSDAYHAAERIRCIVKDLQSFSRSDEKEEKSGFDINKILDTAIKMVWHEIRDRAELDKQYSEVKPAFVSESRILQVFINLLVNAAQAIPKGNKSNNQIQVLTRMTAEGQVAIDIKDTGAGIPTQVQRRMFTPFFTTKPVGFGTGLGLVICQRIIRSLNGEISFTSELGKGTCFTVLLPAFEENLGTSRKTQKERILIVDDEHTDSLKRILSKDYKVYCFNNPEQALDFYKVNFPFDVILCDIRMPEMTGIEFYQKLKIFNPGQIQNFIFMSGDTSILDSCKTIDLSQVHVITKPFKVRELRLLINKVIRSLAQ